MSFQFLQIDRLAWLWLVAAAAVVMALGIIWRRRRLRRLMEAGLAARLAAAPSLPREALRALLLALGLAAIVAALMDPRWGFTFQEVRRRGTDIVFAIDCSRSMLGEDVSPNRLQRAGEHVLETLDRLGGERVALVAFAGVGAVKCPLTLNYAAMRHAIEALAPMEGQRGGSMLAAALDVGADAFVDDGPQSKVLIVLTDGDDQESAPEDLVSELKERGVTLVVVGLGDSSEGARVPILVGGQKRYLTYEGQEVWTKMNAELLRELAVAAGGTFIGAGTKRVDLGEFYARNLAELAGEDATSETVRQAIPRFQWFLAAAFALLLLEGVLADRSGLVDARAVHAENSR
jgi:Ca-activated chloride channel homolog